MALQQIKVISTNRGGNQEFTQRYTLHSMYLQVLFQSDSRKKHPFAVSMYDLPPYLRD